MNLVTRASLSQELLKNLAVLLPTLKEQEEISSFLDKKLTHINQIIIKARQEITSIKEYREAIITAAVTGQINLTDPNQK